MTKYSISLEEVEIALLPVRTRSNNFLKKELYEFTVMKTEEDDDDDDSSANELYTCHICAIEVPSAFSTAHNNGAKHRCNVKIATEATKRMRELLTSNPATTAQRGERFCDPCATVAYENHEKTKEHKQAVEYDRMLIGLSNLYVDEDGESSNTETKVKAVVNKGEKKVNTNAKIIVCNEDINGNDTAKDVKTNANKFTQTVIELTNENNIESINGNDTATGTKPKAVLLANKFTQTTKEVTNTKVNGEDAKRATEYAKIPMDIYIKILKLTFPTVPNFTVKVFGFRQEIQLIVDNVKMIVSSDQFHGFFKDGKQSMCLVCNVVLEPGEQEIHKLAVVHMEAILQKLDDRHCIRKISKTWSHCILCNIRVKKTQTDEHKATKSHLDNQIEHAHTVIWTDKQITVAEITPDEPKRVNNVKAIEIPRIDKVVLAPNQTIPVKNAAKTESGDVTNKSKKAVSGPVKIISEVHSVFPVEERIEYPYEPMDQSSVRCIICSCDVPRPIQNRADHMNGLRHATNVKKQFPPLSGFEKLDSTKE